MRTVAATLVALALGVTGGRAVFSAQARAVGSNPQSAEAAHSSLTVVLLLDVSASMVRQPLLFDPRYAQVFNAFQQGLVPADRAAVGVVAGQLRLSAITSNPRDLSGAVRSLLQVPDADRLSGSPIWDAIDETLPVAAAPRGRSAIVLFSDGKSGGNVHGLDDVITRARQLHVSINVVVEGPGSAFLARGDLELDPAAMLDRLAQQTGGRLLLDRPLNPRQRNPGPLVALMMEELHR